MNRISRTLICAGAALALAAPATAQAHPAASTKSVKAHLDRADAALAAVPAAGDAALDSARAQMRLAQADFNRVLRRARAAGRPGRAAKAGAALARARDLNAETLLGLVDDVAGDLQVAVAQAVAAELRGRERAIAVLTALMEQVPEQARPVIARVITLLSSEGQADAAAITEALALELPPEAEQALRDALEQVTAAITTAMDRLDEVAALVPEHARPYVESALELVSGQLGQVQQMLTALLSGGGLPTGGLPIPSPGSTPGFCVPIQLPFPLPIPAC